MEHSLPGTFAPVELSFLGSEGSKNFRSVEHSLPWNFCVVCMTWSTAGNLQYGPDLLLGISDLVCCTPIW